MLLSLYTYYTERELLSCDNLFPIRLLYDMQINMFKLNSLTKFQINISVDNREKSGKHKLDQAFWITDTSIQLYILNVMLRYQMKTEKSL